MLRDIVVHFSTFVITIAIILSREIKLINCSKNSSSQNSESVEKRAFVPTSLFCFNRKDEPGIK